MPIRARTVNPNPTFMENAEVPRAFADWFGGYRAALSVGVAAARFHAAYQFLKASETIHFNYVYGEMDKQRWKAGVGLSGISRRAWHR